MWTIAEYQPTTFFSLRPSNATTSGGKTLITPTPFSVKMALLDVAIRLYGKKQATEWFPAMRDLQVAIALPQHISVINTFIKILRPHKSGPKDTFGTGLAGPMGNTISYRELVYFAGNIHIGLQANKVAKKQPSYQVLLSQINYLGKRGGFMQFIDVNQQDDLPDGFTILNPEAVDSFRIGGTLQLLDDCGAKMSFAHADVFSGKNISVGKANGRLLNTVILPYQTIRYSQSYTLYERI